MVCDEGSQGLSVSSHIHQITVEDCHWLIVLMATHFKKYFQNHAMIFCFLRAYFRYNLPAQDGCWTSSNLGPRIHISITSHPPSEVCRVGFTLLLVALLSLMLVSCGGSDAGATGTAGTNGTNGTNGINGLASLVSVVNEPAGTNCAAGGYRVNSGLDSSSDGTLQTAEISAVSFICHGSSGTNGTNGTNALTALVSVVNEPAGTNCAAGGYRASSGLDSNGDGTLQAA
jgi:hypothetical protein